MNNTKIVLHAICTSMLLSGLLFHQTNFSMDPTNTKEKKRVKVYSHGFGEPGSRKGPTYPDAPGQILKAVFYTKPAVHTLADYLKNKVDEGFDAIDLEARSCGAGTAVNCLDKLVHYDKNPNYFKGSKIKSKADAEAVVNAINNGSLDFTVPFLSLKKAKAVAEPSKYLGYASIMAACGFAYRWGIFDAALNMVGINPTITRSIATAVTTCAAANYVLGPTAKNAWATAIDATVMPCVTSFNYNPFHTKPIDAVKKLEGRIKCPTLIHCSKDDRVLENPDEDTIKFYNALRKGNEDKTHIFLSEPGDGWHNQKSVGHRNVKRSFKAKYKIPTKQRTHTDSFLKDTQPSTNDLRKKIRTRKVLDE